MSKIISNFDSIIDYLSGDKFSDNFKITYENEGTVRYRNDVLVEMCRGKRILHIGCCDHVPLIGRKVAENDWLHGQLTACSKYTVGIDIDADAVAAAREISGLDNIHAGDITSADRLAVITERSFDYALFGEVVEHIPNPVLFLQRFRENYGTVVEKIIITVPNAFRAGNIKGILKNRETINSDHRFFFTPYTIAKVAFDAGFRPEEVHMATFTRAGARKRSVLDRFPLLAEDIILTATQRARSS